MKKVWKFFFEISGAGGSNPVDDLFIIILLVLGEKEGNFFDLVSDTKTVICKVKEYIKLTEKVKPTESQELLI